MRRNILGSVDNYESGRLCNLMTQANFFIRQEIRKHTDLRRKLEREGGKEGKDGREEGRKAG